MTTSNLPTPSSPERIAQERAMFGCTRADVYAACLIELSADGTPRASADELLLMATSILSDAQEVGARGDAERNRVYINRAKLLINQARVMGIKAVTR